MICKECGAKFDVHKPACPYCGALNYIGAEKEYMEHLKDIENDLSEMSDDSKEAYHATIKKSTLIIITTLCISFLFLILIAGIFYLHSSHSDKKESDLARAQLLWREQYFDDLDRLYEAGDYDGILDFYDEHINDEGFSPYSWEHCDFIEVYDFYTQFLTESASLDMTSLDDMTWCLYDAAQVDYSTTQDFLTYTDEELALIQSWQKETHRFYQEVLGLSDSEIDEMWSVITSDDSLSIPTSRGCKRFLEKYFHL